jgi:hypothetical protein
LAQTDNNFSGAGAPASSQANKEIKLEAPMSYDFHPTFTEGYRYWYGYGDILPNQSAHSSRRVWPAPHHRHHAIQPFVTLQGGFVNFRMEGAPATLGNFL